MIEEDNDAYRFPIEVTARDLDFALKGLIAELDYDLHKAIEYNEENGTDGYPELVVEFYYTLKTLSEQH